jgi:DNA-binding LacI/PurR family transcriptional regulator
MGSVSIDDPSRSREKDALPTMREVAERAGVSPQTVSLVMRGERGPSAASRERVLAVAKELRYRPNASARLLRQRRSGLIGILYAAANMFEARVVERLLERAAEQGFDVVLGPVTPKRTTEVVVTQLLEQRVEALACYNPDPASPALQNAIEMLPVVWLGERAPDLRVDVVRTDEDRGLALLVEHLIGLGHTSIAYAGGLGGSAGPDRAQAYRRAMELFGLAEQIDVLGVGFMEEDGAEAARMLLERGELPTAVIGCSDHCGAGLIGALVRAGVRVPDDISVTGYDDSDLAAVSYIDLTAVRQDVDLTVEATLAAITRRLADIDAPREDRATTASLSVRSSTGPARTGQPSGTTAPPSSTRDEKENP